MAACRRPELAFFAQDAGGNVWNFGEYPEEYTGGQFTGAPDTWITGTGGAHGGLHMLARPDGRPAVRRRAGARDRVRRHLPGGQHRPGDLPGVGVPAAGADGR